jgi:hypothetical protein
MDYEGLMYDVICCCRARSVWTVVLGADQPGWWCFVSCCERKSVGATGGGALVSCRSQVLSGDTYHCICALVRGVVDVEDRVQC